LAKSAASIRGTTLRRPSLNQRYGTQTGWYNRTHRHSKPALGREAERGILPEVFFAQEKKFLTALPSVLNDNLFVHGPISPGIRPMRIALKAIEIKNGSAGSALRPETNH
jgi:hypothetical protein